MIAILQIILVGALLRLGWKLTDYVVYRIINPILFKLGVSFGL